MLEYVKQTRIGYVFQEQAARAFDNKTHVWLADPEEGFIIGEIKETEDTTLTVQTNSGEVLLLLLLTDFLPLASVCNHGAKQDIILVSLISRRSANIYRTRVRLQSGIHVYNIVDVRMHSSPDFVDPLQIRLAQFSERQFFQVIAAQHRPLLRVGLERFQSVFQVNFRYFAKIENFSEHFCLVSYEIFVKEPDVSTFCHFFCIEMSKSSADLNGAEVVDRNCLLANSDFEQKWHCNTVNGRHSNIVEKCGA